MDKHFLEKVFKQHQASPPCPSPKIIASFFTNLLESLFPDHAKIQFESVKEFDLHFQKLKVELDELLTKNPMKGYVDLENVANDFFEKIPYIHSRLEKDITALFEGDPAAKSRSEVIRSYPGFYAIAAYRMAHELHKLGVKVIPRIISEHAHSKTGIDIHPNARIGEHFCIDHGTGVVIGETTVIGDYVKVYQGVTLGALSVDKSDAEKKRHPTLEDHVVIYSGATILGGETTIGHGSIIGGNVWITRSIPPNSKIYYQARMHNSDTDQTDLYVYKENME